MNSVPLILAITGASGAPYAVRLLEMLARNKVPTWLIISGHGWRLLEQETGINAFAAHPRRLLVPFAKSGNEGPNRNAAPSGNRFPHSASDPEQETSSLVELHGWRL